jgi:hypothetical protein
VDLQPAEDLLHEATPTSIERVKRGKRILLLKEVLAELGFVDPALSGNMAAGFPLTGILPEAPEFPASQLRPAPLEREQLWRLAPWAQAACAAATPVAQHEPSHTRTTSASQGGSHLHIVASPFAAPQAEPRVSIIARRSWAISLRNVFYNCSSFIILS